MTVGLGIDVGTTATKIAVVHPERGVIADVSASSMLSSPASGWAEADPQRWWENVAALVPQALAQAGVRCREVAAVAVSGMVPALLVLDRDGKPLRPAILQNDARATREIDELACELADVELVALTGSPLSQQSLAPTLRWLARHEPAVMEHSASLAGSYEWLTRRLGAEPHLEINWATESGLFTLADAKPDARLLKAAGCDASLLAPVRRPGSTVGDVTPHAAAELGLASGTPLVVGGADHVASAHTAGLIADGDTLIKLGGAGDILTVSSGPVVDRRIYLDHHVVEGKWLPNGCMATSGSLLRWFQDGFAAGTELSILDDEAAAAGVGAGGVLCLPYFLGEKSPVHDARARGAFVGLDLSHGRGHVFRACLEAVAFGFRHHLEIFRELGLEVRNARITNGGSRSSLFKQIIADVCELQLEPLRRHPGAAAGAAVAALVGVGSMAWQDVQRFVEPAPLIEPDRAAADRYRARYGLFRELGDVLQPISHELTAPLHPQGVVS
jgi:xylulokinase